MKPEKIYLLGATNHCRQADTIFSQVVLASWSASEYQLLIISAADEKRSTDELHDVVESSCRISTPVTSIVIPMQVFNQWLLKGHLLAHTVYHSDCLIHDGRNTPLKLPGNYSLKDIQQKLQKEFEDWTARSVEFLIGVETFRTRRQYNIGAFLVHQAAELACMAAVRLVTGYRAGTHNLDRLLRYSLAFCGSELNVFPRNTDQERRLFKLLQKAYIHGRYKDDFVITEKEFLILYERVQVLVANAKQLKPASYQPE
ncbi:HEPN domain-containing protein [Pseudoflavitalea sp. X16]|uniref:HEPN domain-containing protein n=1 Tax=Paraflavitalea devenefica TaxID=2716334 RepID=UPI0014244023|nr:HEPN domain-containing protein [Paraflavitalea devenefica]NII25159.1 HEPN domain-containing protein [Paraflavitalea devenefica]